MAGKASGEGANGGDFHALLATLRVEIPAERRSEQKMFGGICFMIDGNMAVGASPARGLLLRVGKDAYGAALAQPGTRPMEMRGRPLEGYVYVDPARLTPAELKDWVALAADFVRTLPPKAKVPKRRRGV
ncbi:TfoX/Sxy family protein [Kaistia geumhonensis]|uniref:TfoX N-terminal domain-containing protein n=1 Tax=Kaistia geumhonensis TaxID=410839 RepID=A0ABU0M9C8_9HYPH|nr:TfoX/Sxy family protein [Kaistia geumhonensis]MCX5477383.1 TfoX/Sxy family protein [Kaistia geumhonensis]MDQ0517410.1 hypothetical protein [Kaistia geumhonensis]